MAGFEVTESIDTIYDQLKWYFFKARNEVIEELESVGYKHIIETLFISDDFQEIKITLKEGFEIGRQDVFEVLAQGGTLLKDGEPIAIKPSTVIRKYLGKR